MDANALIVLKHYGIDIVSLPLADLKPSEWDTWEEAIVKLKIRTDYPIDRTAILCDYWHSLDISVMDGHHRVSSAIARGENVIDAILLPQVWTMEQRDEFWNIFNHRDCGGLCEDYDECIQAKIIVDKSLSGC